MPQITEKFVAIAVSVGAVSLGEITLRLNTKLTARMPGMSLPCLALVPDRRDCR